MRMVVVHTFTTEPEGEALDALLRENGIQVMIRSGHDSVYDGLPLSHSGGNRILVQEQDFERSRLLIQEYLQTIPRQATDDTETLQLKYKLAIKRLRSSLVALWLVCPCLAALGLWLVFRGNGVGGKLLGWILIALAIIFFWSMRAQRSLDQKTISEFNRKAD